MAETRYDEYGRLREKCYGIPGSEYWDESVLGTRPGCSSSSYEMAGPPGSRSLVEVSWGEPLSAIGRRMYGAEVNATGSRIYNGQSGPTSGGTTFEESYYAALERCRAKMVAERAAHVESLTPPEGRGTAAESDPVDIAALGRRIYGE